jgi:hypothetical protein
VELYVRGENAYVVVSNYFNCWYSPVKAAAETFQGSQIAVVNIEDITSPAIIHTIDLQGVITDTRIVGNILYAVASRYAYYYYDTLDTENSTTISSIAIDSPENVRLVDELSFGRTSTSYENNVHVTADMIFLAQYRWGYMDKSGSWVESEATDITCIDISDEQGAIQKGQTATVPGVVSNRWQMDYYNGYFRAVTPEKYWGNGFPSLYIYNVASPDTIEMVSSLTLKIDRPESLMAVRFDGERAYAVTYEQQDPLFTLDLKDPAQPRQLAEIQMSGWIDYIEPRTDHLVTLGHDDAGGTTSLAVSLFDVTSIENPLLIKRITLGDEYGWVSTDINDMHKAFRVLDPLHLILIPFTSWSATQNKELSGVQMVDFFFDSQTKDLIRRGFIDHAGWVERAVPYNDSTVLTVSNEAFQSVDISNRDKPEIKKVLELARNSLAIGSLTEDTGLELSNNNQWYSYDQATSRLSAVPLSDPNTPVPFASLKVPGYFDQLFSMRDCSLISGYRYDEQQGSITVVKTASYNGSAFTMRGSLEITGLNNNYWLYERSPFFYYPYSSSAAAVKVSDTALVYTGYDYFYQQPGTDSYTVVMKAVDATDPAVPRIASTVDIALQGYPTNTLWDGASAYISYAVPDGEQGGVPYYKCYFKVVDFSDLDTPAVSLGINIPGNVVGRSLSGQYIYTIDYQYAVPPESYTYEVYLNILEPIEGKAYLRDRKKIVPAPVSGNDYYAVGTVVVKNERAYYVINHTACDGTGSQCQNDAQLVTADLSSPENIQFPSSQTIQMQNADIIDAVQDKLFLYTYYNVGGILVYSLANAQVPEFESFYRTDYYPGGMVVIKDTAYLPSGMYGVKMIPLQ